MRQIFRILIGLLVCSDIYSQDTLRLDSPIHYFSETDSLKILTNFKENNYSKIDFSREILMYSSDSVIMELCFYYDGVRYCNQNKIFAFTKDSDSVIVVTNGIVEKWGYQLINDSLFYLERKFKHLIESGYAKRILPLEKIDKFNVRNQSGDTLWTTNYIDIVYPEISTKEVIIKDSVYHICEIMPEYLSGQSNFQKDIAKNLYLGIMPMDYGDFCAKYFVSFIIDKQGKIKNMKFKRSCGNGFVERAILISIANLGLFSSGYMNNEPVNVEMILPLNIDLQ